MSTCFFPNLYIYMNWIQHFVVLLTCLIFRIIVFMTFEKFPEVGVVELFCALRWLVKLRVNHEAFWMKWTDNVMINLYISGCTLISCQGLCGLTQLRHLEELELTNCPSATKEIYLYLKENMHSCLVLDWMYWDTKNINMWFTKSKIMSFSVSYIFNIIKTVILFSEVTSITVCCN